PSDLFVFAPPHQSKPAVHEYALLTSPVSEVSSNTIPASPNPRHSRVSFRVKPDHVACDQPASLFPTPGCKHWTVRFGSYTDTRGDDSLEERLGLSLPSRSCVWNRRGGTCIMDTLQSLSPARRQSRLLRSLAGR